MIPLQITAYLLKPIAVSDDYSPTIDGIIEYSIREQLGLLDPNPLPGNTQHCDLPIKYTKSGVAHASSPRYTYFKESVDKYVKRVEFFSQHLDKPVKKFSGSEGHYKNYQLPLFTRITDRIGWFVVGDKNEIELALSTVTGIGKKRSYGYGLIEKWSVKEIENDWSIYGADNELMRPIPCGARGSEIRPHGCSGMMIWAWKNPTWWSINQSACWMPKNNVQLIST